MVRFALAEPAGIETLFGDPTMLPNTLTAVVVTAGESSVTVAVTGSPARADDGLTLMEMSCGGRMMTVADWLTPKREALIDACALAATGVVVIVNVADVAPAGMTAVPGTDAAALSETRVIVVSVTGAVPS